MGTNSNKRCIYFKINILPALCIVGGGKILIFNKLQQKSLRQLFKIVLIICFSVVSIYQYYSIDFANIRFFLEKVKNVR